MQKGRKEYTFYWVIENYSYCWHMNGKELKSPNFTVNEFNDTTWSLHLYPRGDEDEEELTIFLKRYDDNGPLTVFLSIDLSLIGADGIAFYRAECSDLFDIGRSCGVGLLQAKEFFSKRHGCIFLQDTLSVCCKMYEGEGNVCNVGQSFARTRVKVEKISFLHCVESFSKLQPSKKHTTKIRYFSKRQSFLTSSLRDCTGESITFEIELSDTTRVLGKCEISLINISGTRIEFGRIDNRYEASRQKTHTVPLPLSREEILSKKSEYLLDDKLSLMCECTFSSGIELFLWQETLNEIPSHLNRHRIFSFLEKSDFQAAEKVFNYSSVLEDIKSLYIYQNFTDMEVTTKTKSFPAHKLILCARSPVFSAMLTNDKRENTNCVHVDDLEDGIVQQLLFFLYTDNVENMQWETATKLYYAADKYKIGKLKEICSSYLLENLTTSNAGELLLLADTHNNRELKKTVEDFIFDNDELVFGSSEWEMLMETNPLLSMKTMHLKYKRNK